MMPVQQTKSIGNTDRIQAAKRLFNIEQWSAGYFDIRDDGSLICRPSADAQQAIALPELMQRVLAEGLSAPVLIRFQDILTHRLQALCAAFDHARERRQYTAKYTAVYPIKVNQQRCVVEQILQAAPGRVGLEAGSKPELMAVLAQTFDKRSADDHETLICNGYKDSEYIRLALLGGLLGKRVVIVIEQPRELELILAQARQLAVTPCLGVRVRLGSIAKGKWQNSGGEKSKFGLSAGQLLKLVQRLRDNQCLHWLQLLHVHMGSQVADLADIRRGVQETAGFLRELHALGAAIQIVDVGGGLGVDYAGTASDDEFSINYSLQDYADTVVDVLASQCVTAQLPLPEIITECGRAMTAHHAVLIADLVDIERIASDTLSPSDATPEQNPFLSALLELQTRIRTLNSAQQAKHCLSDYEAKLAATHTAFTKAEIDLPQRAAVEQQVINGFKQLQQRIETLLQGCDDPASIAAWRPIMTELHTKLADKYFCNFSLFQSLPDIWGIQQLFPIMPLTELHQPLTGHAVVHDLTCDSDGQIAAYPQQGSVSPTLPVPEPEPGKPYYLGFFLVGAYQEILGDMHNLFGDTHSINVLLDAEHDYRLEGAEPGDRVDQLLEYVHYDSKHLLAQYKLILNRTELSDAAKQQYYQELAAGLSAYTYLA